MARISPYLRTSSVERATSVFHDVLGLREVYSDSSRCVVYEDASRGQLVVLTHEIRPDAPIPRLRVEVDNVDLVHERVVALGLSVLLPPTDESWARRFFFEDFDGHVHLVLTPTDVRPATRSRRPSSGSAARPT